MRNYSFEHEKRKALNKRLYAYIEREKAETFVQHLKQHGTNYSAWLNKQIDSELKQP